MLKIFEEEKLSKKTFFNYIKNKKSFLKESFLKLKKQKEDKYYITSNEVENLLTVLEHAEALKIYPNLASRSERLIYSYSLFSMFFSTCMVLGLFLNTYMIIFGVIFFLLILKIKEDMRAEDNKIYRAIFKNNIDLKTK